MTKAKNKENDKKNTVRKTAKPITTSKQSNLKKPGKVKLSYSKHKKLSEEDAVYCFMFKHALDSIESILSFIENKLKQNDFDTIQSAWASFIEHYMMILQLYTDIKEQKLKSYFKKIENKVFLTIKSLRVIKVPVKILLKTSYIFNGMEYDKGSVFLKSDGELSYLSEPTNGASFELDNNSWENNFEEDPNILQGIMKLFYKQERTSQNLIKMLSKENKKLRNENEDLKKSNKYQKANNKSEYLSGSADISVDAVNNIQDGMHIPIFGNSFTTGRKILLAAKPGVGKNFLSIEIAKRGLESGNIRHPCFFNFDDKENSQLPRYTESFSQRKYEIVDYNQWQEYLKNFKQRITTESETKAMVEMQYRSIEKYGNLVEKHNKKQGINHKRNYRVDAFNELITEKINVGCDFFVLDSLSKVFINTNNIANEQMDVFLDIPPNITFIVIHHLDNAAKKIRGNQSINKPFESIYFLIDEKKVSNDNGTMLKIDVRKNRHDPEDLTFYIKRKKISKNVASHELINETEYATTPLKNSATKNLKKTIKEYLLNCGKKTVTFNTLTTFLGNNCNKHSIKNVLKELKDDKIIEMADGRTWGKIKFIPLRNFQ
ncbi:MAG: hypothetical protein LBK08_10560 [Treponema sp.]|nr:hypothetical protein [Treponema sp.]